MDTLIAPPLSSLQSSELNSSEPTSPLKDHQISIDLFELVNVKEIKHSSSRVSTHDTVSTKTEEDTTKSMISEPQGPRTRRSRRSKNHTHEKTATLKDIISKRCQQKKLPKTDRDSPRIQPPAYETRRRHLQGTLLDCEEEKIVKKEKLNDGSCALLVKEEEPKIPKAPKLVIKNGKTCVQEEINEQMAEKPLVEVTTTKKTVTSNSFKKVNYTEKWTEEETELFYRALQLFGTDFSLITKLFPNRNRNQVKNKFLKEEKTARSKIDSVFQSQHSLSTKKIIKHANNYLNKKVIKADEDAIERQAQEQISTKPENTRIRSESFHSACSMNSLDENILENLSDLLTTKAHSTPS